MGGREGGRERLRPREGGREGESVAWCGCLSVTTYSLSPSLSLFPLVLSPRFRLPARRLAARVVLSTHCHQASHTLTTSTPHHGQSFLVDRQRHRGVQTDEEGLAQSPRGIDMPAHACTHAYKTHTRIQRARGHTHTHTHTHTQTHTHTHTYIQNTTHTHRHKHTHKHTHTHGNTQTHTQIHTHTHTHAQHAHTHTRTREAKERQRERETERERLCRLKNTLIRSLFRVCTRVGRAALFSNTEQKIDDK